LEVSIINAIEVSICVVSVIIKEIGILREKNQEINIQQPKNINKGILV